MRALRKEEPVQIVVAVPVGARDSCEELSAEVDDLVCQLQAVGLWYQDFAPTSDDEVRELLAKGAHGLENRVG